MDFTSDLPALRAKVDELADGAVEQLSQLMAIQSVSSWELILESSSETV